MAYRPSRNRMLNFWCHGLICSCQREYANGIIHLRIGTGPSFRRRGAKSFRHSRESHGKQIAQRPEAQRAGRGHGVSQLPRVMPPAWRRPGAASARARTRRRMDRCDRAGDGARVFAARALNTRSCSIPTKYLATDESHVGHRRVRRSRSSAQPQAHRFSRPGRAVISATAA